MGNPNFENFKKREGAENKIGGEGNQKGGGGDFKNERGNSTFQVEFRDKKGQNWRPLETH